MHWLVDGNNLLHLLPEIMWSVGAAGQPAALAALLKPYRDAKKLNLTIIFDGGDREHNARLSGLPVVFAGPEKNADQVIVERLQKVAPGSLGLVSNDQALADIARQMGAQVARADALATKLKIHQGLEDNENAGWGFSTRKKGPARRLPKAKRKQNRLLEKL